jgi:hypothetical protein
MPPKTLEVPQTEVAVDPITAVKQKVREELAELDGRKAQLESTLAFLDKIGSHVGKPEDLQVFDILARIYRAGKRGEVMGVQPSLSQFKAPLSQVQSSFRQGSLANKVYDHLKRLGAKVKSRDIANGMGINPEKISYILSRLKAKGFARSEGKTSLTVWTAN